MIAAIEAALQHDVAGDPITGIRWTRRTTEKIATELATLDIQVCPRTVARILKDLDYRLRVNHKRVSAGSGPDRDQQFQYIAEQHAQFAQRGLPIVSIDTKKRELIGNCRQQLLPPPTAGRASPRLYVDQPSATIAHGHRLILRREDLAVGEATRKLEIAKTTSRNPASCPRSSPTTTKIGPNSFAWQGRERRRQGPIDLYYALKLNGSVNSRWRIPLSYGSASTTWPRPAPAAESTAVSTDRKVGVPVPEVTRRAPEPAGAWGRFPDGRVAGKIRRTDSYQTKLGPRLSDTAAN